jgi:type IV pilus assembly protein PilW
MALGLLVVLAAIALLLAVTRSRADQEDMQLMEENGRYGLEVLSRAVRLGGLAAAGQMEGRTVAPGFAPVFGLDASTLSRDSIDISAPAPSPHSSDVLAVRYRAAGDGTSLNCAGFPAAPDPSEAGGGSATSWSIFYLARDAGGEPQLYCKYAGANGWSADAVVRGVEAFQVLYGVDGDGDGIAERMLPASAIGPPDDSSASPWNRVVSVRVALLLRGAQRRPGTGAASPSFDLFGTAYSERHGSADRGVRLSGAELGDDHRLRKLVSSTIQLRNRRQEDQQ